MNNKMQTMTDEDLSLKLFIVLTRALDAVKKSIEKDIRTYGLNPTEFAVLELIYSQGEQPIQRIGEKVLIASSSITYVVDKLEKKGYLRRNPSPSDRRIIFASITPEGIKKMDDIFPDHKKQITKILGGLNEEEKRLVITHLKTLGNYAKDI